MSATNDYCLCGTPPDPDAPLGSSCRVCGKPHYIFIIPALPQRPIDPRPAQLLLEDPGAQRLRVAAILQDYLSAPPAEALRLIRSTPAIVCDVDPDRVVDIEEGVLAHLTAAGARARILRKDT